MWEWELDDPIQGIVNTPTAVGNHSWPFGGPSSQNSPPYHSVSLTVYDNFSNLQAVKTKLQIVVHELPNVEFTVLKSSRH